MSPETRELIGVLAGTIPWLVLVAGIVWSTVMASHDRSRHDREPTRMPTRDGRSPSADLEGVRALRHSGTRATARGRSRGVPRAVAPGADG